MTCDDLPVIHNGEVSYTSPRSVSPSLPDGKRYVGTIATYNCSSGYQLVGGSLLRICGANGQWNGTAPSCGKYCQRSGVLHSYCNSNMFLKVYQVCLLQQIFAEYI